MRPLLSTPSAPARAMWPLYAAGFTTAFGAHGIAANLGASSADAVTSLLVLGGLLALYDGAEVVLKPVFGSLADRIGARPVLLGGLLAFAAASAAYAVADSPGWLWAARLGQGAAASAFSPSATAAGLLAAMLPGLPGVLIGAVLIGAGTGMVTPLGFAALAGATPQERLGQTMDAAELGRELGDAGGPLLVAAIATATALSYGFAALALLLAIGAVVAFAVRRRTAMAPGPASGDPGP